MKHVAQEFMRGLIKPSFIAVSIAMVMNLLVVLAVILAIDEKFMASPAAEYLAFDERDYDLFATNEFLKLKYYESNTSKMIVFGGSTTRAVLKEKNLENALNDHGLSNVSVVKLCTARQKLWDVLAFVMELPKNVKAVVVLGLTPGQFNAGYEDLKAMTIAPRIGFYSKVIQNLMRKYEINYADDTGIYSINHKNFLSDRMRNLAKNVLTGKLNKPVKLDTYYTGLPPKTRDKYLKHSTMVKRRFEKREKNLLGNLEILEQIIRQVEKNDNLQLALFESPVNPAFLTEFSLLEIFEEHEKIMKKIASEYHLIYKNANDLGQLNPDHFYDWAHVTNYNAIKTICYGLISNIAPLLSK